MPLRSHDSFLDDNELNDDDIPIENTKLKVKVELATHQICESIVKEVVAKAKREREEVTEFSISPQSIHSLTQLILGYSKPLVEDLVHFSKHGKRSTIGVDDVKLLARKSPDIQTYLSENMDKRKRSMASSNRPSKKHRGTGEQSSTRTASTVIDEDFE